jgi:two-component system, sensor histidine kinase and response regulator
MGGQTWVESQPGRGSTFHFTARLGVEKEATTPVALRAEANWLNLPVLVVDDNTTNRRILEGVLTNWQMRPTAVEGGKQALQALGKARKAGEPFRLVLLDAQMPEMDGFSLAEAIKGNPDLAGATIMMLSSSGQPGDAARCRDLGVAAYLTKPVKQSELRAAILNSLGATFRKEGKTEIPLRQHTLRENTRHPHILLAEDNVINQKLAMRLLEKEGHTVVVAGNGRQAVAAFESETFDLILMDVQMPEMNGYEATAAIREKEKAAGGHIPIVAMTAHAMKGDRERCMEAGMDGYLSKPIKAQLLYTTVEQLANRVSVLEDAGAILLMAEDSAQHEANQRSIFEQATLEGLGGDEELFIEIANLFLDEHQEMLTIIKEAIRIGDGPALERAAHTLKGTAGNFSARGVVEISLELEKIGSSGVLDRSHEVYVRLEREMKGLTVSLGEFVKGKVPCVT